MSTGTVVLGEKLAAVERTEAARAGPPELEALPLLALRDSVWLRDRKRRLEAERLGGAKGAGEAGVRGGELGPRRAWRRERAASQRVRGAVVEGPRCPQPECWVKLA